MITVVISCDDYSFSNDNNDIINNDDNNDNHDN